MKSQFFKPPKNLLLQFNKFLSMAVIENNAEDVDQYILLGAFPDSKTADNLLQISITHKNKEIMRLLLRHSNISPDAITQSIFRAIQNDDIPALTTLLENKKRYIEKKRDGETPLQFSKKLKRTNPFQLLVYFLQEKNIAAELEKQKNDLLTFLHRPFLGYKKAIILKTIRFINEEEMPGEGATPTAIASRLLQTRIDLALKAWDINGYSELTQLKKSPFFLKIHQYENSLKRLSRELLLVRNEKDNFINEIQHKTMKVI